MCNESCDHGFYRQLVRKINIVNVFTIRMDLCPKVNLPRSGIECLPTVFKYGYRIAKMEISII